MIASLGLGAWASIVALSASLYSTLWFFRARRYLHTAICVENSGSVASALYKIQHVENFVEREPDLDSCEEPKGERHIYREKRMAAFKSARDARRDLERFIEEALGISLVDTDALLAFAEYYRKRAQLGKALVWYGRALAHYKELHTIDELTRIERSNYCHRRRRECRLALWDFEPVDHEPIVTDLTLPEITSICQEATPATPALPQSVRYESGPTKSLPTVLIGANFTLKYLSIHIITALTSKKGPTLKL